MKFIFGANSYFEGTELKVEVYKKHQMPEKKVCTEIKWKEACNPTVKKQKKKKGGKKVNVTVKQDSFFNLFASIDPTNKTEKTGDNDNEEPEGDEDADMQLQEDIDTAEQIKDDLIPLALEYYLGVIEGEEGEDDEDDEDEDDEDGSKKKKKKAPAANQQECKQQ